jgi:hypothetical protein
MFSGGLLEQEKFSMGCKHEWEDFGFALLIEGAIAGKKVAVPSMRQISDSKGTEC